MKSIILHGSNSPTFLTYIILSTRVYLPWRTAVYMGTNRRDSSTRPCPGFSRSERKIRTPATTQKRISLLEVSRELDCLYRKKNSFRISWRRLQVTPDEHSREGSNCMPFWGEPGPFSPNGCALKTNDAWKNIYHHRHRISAKGLRSIDSCVMAVHTKPFLMLVR